MSHQLRKLILTTLIALALILAGAYLFLLFRGKAILINRLEKMLHKEVTIGDFKVSAPLNIRLSKVKIEGLGSIDSVFVSVSAPSLLIGRLTLGNIRIIKPELTLERFAHPQGVSAGQPAHASKKPDRALVFRNLTIKDGRINFIDHTAAENGIKLTLKDLNANVSNHYSFPVSFITSFDISGRIPWQQGSEEGKVKAEGWMNLIRKDMEASLKITDIDGISLYPYYSLWVDLEKARIEKATLNFISTIHGLNNNVTADCHLELADIVRKPRSPEDSPEREKAEQIADAVLDLFRAMNQGKIVLDFIIRTKMDRPEFGFKSVKSAFEEKLALASKANGSFQPQDLLMLPGKLLEGAVKGATDFSKAVIEGTFAVGNQLKKSVEDTFKKEPKKEEGKK